MHREIQMTLDGSCTIVIPELNVSYHSTHGALQESLHIYIEEGLNYAIETSVRDSIEVFEMGFGTGLNALLTILKATEIKKKINYYTVEKFPLSIEEAQKLHYDELLKTNKFTMKLHEAEWEKEVAINEYFTIYKTCQTLTYLQLHKQFDVIYFDAFAPTVQPELWTKDVFAKMFYHLNNYGVLVTYSSKADVRRAMKAAGFIVEKLRGPKGKAEIVRATRIDYENLK